MSMHGRQTVAKGIHAPIAWTFADVSARTSFTITEGVPALEAQLTSDDLYKLAWQIDIEAVFILTAISPLTWKQITPASVSISTNRVVVSAIKGTAGTVSVGQAVYITGYDDVNAAIEVELAQANSSSTMNAIGIVSATATDTSVGSVTINGEIDGLDTSSFSINDSIHVSASAAGGLTNTPPAGPNIHQNLGAVTKVDASDGRILVSYQAEEPLSDSTPSPVGAAAAGTSAMSARSDHVHAHGDQGGGSLHANAVASGAAGFMTGADKSKLDGIAASAASLTSTAPVNVTKAAAAVGVGTTAARHDHKHDVTTAAPGSTGVATSSGEGTSTSLARADHVHQSNTAPVDVTKAAAAIGTSGQPARADHKHDVTTAAAGAVQAGASAAEGSATSLARSDHTHSVAVATPATIGSANAPGSANSFVRSDHVHAHGDQAGGTLHAAATTSVNGFMSPTDKTKLDAMPPGSSGQIPYNNGSGNFGAEAGFSYDAAGNQFTAPGATITEDVLFTGVISPTSLSSNQNNYAPTGFATASTLRLTSSTAVNITGLAGGANGRFIILHNIGSNNIVLVNSSGSSTASNQFLFNGNITLGANQSVTLRYDGTSSRWRATGGTGSGASVTPFRKVYAAYDFLTPVTNYAVNASAGYAADTANAALFVRRFDDTTQEGVGFGLSIPAGMTSLTLYFKSRAQSTPGGTVGVQPILYFRTIPDNASVSSWSAGTQLTPLSFPTNTNWQYDSQTLTLSSLSLTAGNYVQFELTRDGGDGDDLLSGDWTLLEMTVEFT